MEKTDNFDIVVIGGGPAGSMAALKAAEMGLSVLLVERDNVIGSPVRCAEGVDHKGLKEFFEPDPVWISSVISGYSLIAPDDTVVDVHVDDKGYILERTVFDRMIAEKAASNGAVVMTGTEASGMSVFENGSRTVNLRCEGSEWSVKARIVVAADGVESSAARWAGLKTSTALHKMDSCAQVLAAGIEVDPHLFKMFFSGEYAPGGYAWIFPKGPDKANIGLGISGDYALEKSPSKHLDDFLTHYFPGVSIVGRTYGGISCSGGIKKLYADGVMVAGDAAHLANPITGAGIVNAMISGKLAAETANDALKKGNTGESNLKAYSKLCDGRIGKMNRMFYRIKEGIYSISDEKMNEIAHEIVKLPQDKQTPLRILRSAFVKNPALLRLLPRLVF
ncbi:NAD(P)/FAD-dependent oxidoreductase [Candidatus Latescibacterota bacterium]